MAVIAEYQFGGTKIRIHDDCCVKTEKENQEILKRVAAIATDIYMKELKKEAS